MEVVRDWIEHKVTTLFEGDRETLKRMWTKTPGVTQSRRNAMGVGLVFEANLRSSIHPSLWTLQGVALVLNIDT